MKKRRKTGEKWPRNSGLKALGYTGVELLLGRAEREAAAVARRQRANPLAAVAGAVVAEVEERGVRRGPRAQQHGQRVLAVDHAVRRKRRARQRQPLRSQRSASLNGVPQRKQVKCQLTVAKMSSVETISIETEPAAMRPGQRAKAGIRRFASHVEPSPRSEEHGMPSRLRIEQTRRSGSSENGRESGVSDIPEGLVGSRDGVLGRAAPRLRGRRRLDVVRWADVARVRDNLRRPAPDEGADRAAVLQLRRGRPVVLPAGQHTLRDHGDSS